MAEIAPPPPTGAASPPAPPPTAVANNPPPGLVDLPPGARLDATVIALPEKGLVQVATEHGPVQLRSALALPDKATLQLVLQSRAPSLVFIIAAINGRPVPGAAAAAGAANPLTAGLAGSPGGAATAGGGGGAAATPALAPTPVTLTVGAELTGILIRPTVAATTPATATNPAGVANPLAAGATTAAIGLAATAANASAGTATTPATGGSPANVGAPGAGTAAPTTGNAAANPAGALTAGTQLPLRVISVTPPGTSGAIVVPPAAGGARPVPGQPLHGVVISTAGGGNQAVVQTPFGTVSLATPTVLPPGTSLTLELTAPPRPPTGALHPTAHGASQQAIDQATRAALVWAREWPALEESLEALEEIAPGALRQVTTAALPRPDTQLSANVLFFLSALRAGDIRSWFGDGPTRILQRLRTDVANRLGDDFAHLSRVADEPTGDWRLSVAPFLAEDEIQKIRLLTRRQEDEDDEDDEDKAGTRFVVDLDLSRLGRMQLDGLVASGGKRVDLVIRTDRPLPPHMQNDIRDIFTEASELTGMTGGVGFQSQPAGFVDIQPEVTSGGLGLEV